MKKILFFLVFVMLFCLLVSCGNSKYDLSLAKVLQEEKYCVDFTIERDNIEEVAEALDVKANGINGIMYAEPENGDYEEVGVIFFCDSTKSAKTLQKSLKKFINEMDKDDYIYFKGGIVKRIDSTVFIGCEDVWEVIK